MPRSRISVSKLGVLVALALFALAFPAAARDTERFVNVREVASSERARGFLLDVPYYMKGETAPAVAKRLSTFEVSRSSSGAFRSDQRSCEAAFLDALKILQEKARSAGASALVELVSTTRGVEYESASTVRCVAGSLVAHVGLRATAVVFEETPPEAD